MNLLQLFQSIKASYDAPIPGVPKVPWIRHLKLLAVLLQHLPEPLSSFHKGGKVYWKEGEYLGGAGLGIHN